VRLPLNRPAVAAGTEDLQRVADVGEAVLAGHPVGPLLDGRPGHLDGAPSAAADQVVVLPAAPAVRASPLSVRIESSAPCSASNCTAR
jgi:hypothetical protein